MINTNSCTREKEVLQAFAAGLVSVELQAHLAQCSACRNAVAIVKGFRILKSSAMQKATTPNVHWIMLQAKWREEELVLKRFTLMNRLGVFSGIALFTGMTTFLLQKNFEPGNAFTSDKLSLVIPVIIYVLLSETLLKNVYKTIKGKA
jgi:predicted anti-sigma-YlaC factor YlaD